MKNLFIVIAILVFIISIGCGQNNKNNDDIRYKENELISPSSKTYAVQFYNTGYRAFSKGDYKKAIELYKKAIAIDANYIDAYDNCGLSYRRLNILDSAEVYYKKSIAMNPKVMIAHGNLAIVYSNQGKWDDALNEYNEIKKYNPEDPEAYYGAADVYFRINDIDNALKNALSATRLFGAINHPYLCDAEFYVGLAYYRKNDKLNAKKYMQDAMYHGRKIGPEYISEFSLK